MDTGSASSYIHRVSSDISSERLKGYVYALEGLRHAWDNYEALEEKASFIEDTFRSYNLQVESQYLTFHGRTYRNIIGTMECVNDGDSGTAEDKEWILLGAHYDAAWGSPGADDNASGMAVLLEAAKIISREKPNRTIQFVAFTLEEPQPQTIRFLIGSEFFAKEAKRLNRRYASVIILESVGYTDKAEGSQVVPAFVRIPVSRKGDFLGIVANRHSKALMNAFYNIARVYVPELRLVPYKVPLSGYIVPETRFSDHASFWNYRYPAIMLTDTAMFRNPHYHSPHDSHDTLDFAFIANVTKAVVGFILRLYGL